MAIDIYDETDAEQAAEQAASAETAAEQAAAAEQTAEYAETETAEHAEPETAETADTAAGAAEAAAEAEPDGEDAEPGEPEKSGCGKAGEKEPREKLRDKKKLHAELTRLEARTKELEAKAAEEKDKYARLAAEYDNYRKRTARELDGRYADAKADTWKNLLTVVDNFERALAVEPAGGEKDAFREGIELTYKLLKEQMDKAGVTEIEAKGLEFDPGLHNAVMHCEDETLGENVVADVFVKGYKLGDKVLRHSMVRVAN